MKERVDEGLSEQWPELLLRMPPETLPEKDWRLGRGRVERVEHCVGTELLGLKMNRARSTTSLIVWTLEQVKLTILLKDMFLIYFILFF